ncbi:kelch-like protein 41 isoform X3 [Tachypleus tridentatus]|uniref:kelch-like protein 41 isoform X3 n=1 Tax=Tachypleus tridentatus TaxID=6853 RepID=UPI003FD45C7C
MVFFSYFIIAIMKVSMKIARAENLTTAKSNSCNISVSTVGDTAAIVPAEKSDISMDVMPFSNRKDTVMYAQLGCPYMSDSRGSDVDHYTKLGHHTAMLWKKNNLIDVTVQIGTHTFQAHKAVLSCFSPVFKQHICEKEINKISKLCIDGITPAAFEFLLKFMYTGQMKPGIQIIGDVYHASRKLGIKEISEKCIKLLRGQEELVSTLYIYAISKNLGLQKTSYLAYQVILERFGDIITIPEFMELEADQLCEILSGDVIGTNSEIVLYLAALKWLDYDFLRRVEHIHHVMSCIRFSSMCLEEILACYDPPILSCVTRYPTIRDMLLRATCFIAAKSTKQDMYFKEYASCPRQFLVKYKRMLGWHCVDWYAIREYNDATIKIQAYFRAYYIRNKFLRGKEAVIKLQAHVRGYFVRKNYRTNKPKLTGFSNKDIPLDDPSVHVLVHHCESVLFGHHRINQVKDQAISLPSSNGAFQEPSSPVILLLGGINLNISNIEETGDKILRYLPMDDKWEECGHLPEARHHHVAVLFNRSVYIIGGYDPQETAKGKPLAKKTCFRYKLDTCKWQKVADMNYARVYHGAVALAGFLYVIGGKDDEARLLSSVELYNSDIDTWSQLDTFLNFPRMAMGVAVHRNQLWISGGIAEKHEKKWICDISNVDRFIPKHNKWSSDVAYLPSPRSFVSMVESKGSLYVMGGRTLKEQYTDDNYLSITAEIFIYIDATNQWITYTPFPSPRHGVAVSILALRIPSILSCFHMILLHCCLQMSMQHFSIQ